MGSSSCRFARHLKLYIFYIRIFFQGFFLGSDFQFVSECESRWIWNVCAGIERSLLWRHIFANALVAKRIKKLASMLIWGVTTCRMVNFQCT